MSKLWNRHRALLLLAIFIFLASIDGVAGGEEAQPPPNAEKEPTPTTVAIMQFKAHGGQEQLGEMIHGTVEAMLSGQPGYRMVDRQSLMQILSEQGLTLSGVSDEGSALKIGRVAGAQILVSGQVFELGESRMITAKLIGTETTLTESVIVKGELDEPLDALVLEVGNALVEKLNQAGPTLVASDDGVTDPIPELVAALKEGQALPVFAVIVTEEHRSRRPLSNPPDPAVETELKQLLLQAGAEIRDVKDNALAAWVTEYEAGGNPSWPRTLEGVDIVLTGEAFSEFAGVLGQLQLASARAEINVINRADGAIVYVDRTTTRGIDLAEEIAGKSALEKAGRILGERLLVYLLKFTTTEE